MEFEQRKAAALAAISSPSPDKSPKGTIDTPIISLLNTINSHPSYFTTSSCSGRISVFSHPATSSPKGTGKWVFISHQKAHPNTILPIIFNQVVINPLDKNSIEQNPFEKTPFGDNPFEINHNEINPIEKKPIESNPLEKIPIGEYPFEKNSIECNHLEKTIIGESPIEINYNEKITTGKNSFVRNPLEKNSIEHNPLEINPNEKNPSEKTSIERCVVQNTSQSPNLVFRFEPLIIAIDCVDVAAANRIVSIAIKSGFRESGITSVSKRVIVGIRCSIKLEVPLGDEERVLVSPEYVTWLVEVANEKMEANRRRTDGFLAALLSNGFVGDGENVSIEGRALSHGVDDKRGSSDTNLGSSKTSDISLDMNQLITHGEPVEKIFLWGHSACTLNETNSEKIIIFGGFGGMGRHARRNDSVLLDPLLGKLEVITTRGSPSPRLGHTCSMVGDLMYLIGGRADPLNILNDVWIFDREKSEWKSLECSGCLFPPSHRHAAAVIDTKIYIFGGLSGDIVSSSLYVLDTSNLEWSEIPIQGEWPSGRHSHTFVSHKFQLYIFGGCNGEKALGDFYSFDTQTCLWKKEIAFGRNPCARFSHSMFVYNDFVGILGGCPVTQHYHELSLFDLRIRSWRHVLLNSIGRDLFVRCAVSVIGDILVIVGGGAACYAFGTKFSEPIKINLLPLIYLDNKLSESKVNHGVDTDEGVVEYQDEDSHWVLEVKKEYAKLSKDMLKNFGWLDLGRKVYTRENGLQICFPVSNKFCNIYKDKKIHRGESENGSDLKPFKGETVVKDLTCLTAIHILISFDAIITRDEVVKVKRPTISPLKVMSESIASLLKDKGLSSELIEQLPTRWERLGDIYVLPVSSFKDPTWDSIGDELWSIVARSLGAQRLARQGRVAPTGTRDSTLEILVGDNGWVEHRENGIIYSFDTTKCMFSWGNLSEKLRMARLDCKDEVIVDLFAGIGYFVLPFLVRANAKQVYACEWNPYAVEALRRNVEANSVNDRCIILEGDNRITAPKGVADRVCLGLIPTSEGSWVTAVRALRSVGGLMHVHGNVKDTEEGSWTEHVLKSIQEISRSEGNLWEVSIEHTERVKWYAPHIRHMVVDIRCKEAKIAARDCKLVGPRKT